METLLRASLTAIRTHAAVCVDTLVCEIANDRVGAPSFQAARRALAALPLTTAEAATHMNRLDNALHYFHAGEGGAARYELRLLARSAALEGDAALRQRSALHARLKRRGDRARG